MTHRTFTIFTSDQGAARMLRKNIQIILTVTPSEGLGEQRSWTAIAWRSWEFQAFEQQTAYAELDDTSFMIDVANTVDGYIIGAGAYAGLGSDQYLEYSEERWQSHRLSNSGGRVMAINRSLEMQQFVIGTTLGIGNLEPFVIMTGLPPDAAVMLEVPHTLQIFTVEAGAPWNTFCVPSESTACKRLLPPIVIAELPNDVSWQLFTDDDGQLTLEEDVFGPLTKTPNPITIPSHPQSPGFGDGVLTPNTVFSVPLPPLSNIGSPNFLSFPWTPPAVPWREPPDTPSGLGSPGFLFSPLLLSQEAPDVIP